MNVVRELCKTFMVITSLAFPILLSVLNKSANYLWFLILSVFLIVEVLSHYESLQKESERSESLKKEAFDE